MPRPTINPTNEFYQAVETYRKSHQLKSWSQAVLALAAIGLESETGTKSPKPAKDEWGGNRQMKIKYYAQPLWDFRPDEFAAEVGEVEESEIDVEGQTVTVIAPKGYELKSVDHARIDELINEK